MRKNKFNLKAYDVAKEYWALPLKNRTFQNVRQSLDIPSDKKNQITDNYLSQLARLHENRGLVQHLVLPDRTPLIAERATEYSPLLPEIEDRMRRSFGLRDAVVIDTSTFRPGPDEPWKPKDDDLLHEHLGRWAGRILASLVRPLDVIATGGGRGPFDCAHFCTITPRSIFPKKVVSLTGFISAGMWRQGLAVDDNTTKDVDADHIASLLHAKLGTREIALLNCEIASGKRLEMPKDVSIAVVGIGALGGEHRLKHWQQLEDLKASKDDVEKLIAEVADVDKQFGDSFSHCVGDICNSYFVSDHVKETLTNGENVSKKLSKLVDKINNAFTTVCPSELAALCKKGVVIAVAGGPHKTRIIEHVLKQGKAGSPWITHLVTSDEVAKSILNNI